MTSGQRLFVYGTLMGAAQGRLGRQQRARLDGEARSLGPATTIGQLFDLGEYPGLVVPALRSGQAVDVGAAPDADLVVHGEVFELLDADASFAWLDAYEGVTEGGSTDDEYLRRMIDVELQSGGKLSSWSYVFIGSLAGRRCIENGYWLVVCT